MVEKKANTVKNAGKSAVKKDGTKHIGLVKNDAYLAPYEDAIRGRHDHAEWKLNQLTGHFGGFCKWI